VVVGLVSAILFLFRLFPAIAGGFVGIGIARVCEAWPEWWPVALIVAVPLIFRPGPALDLLRWMLPMDKKVTMLDLVRIALLYIFVLFCMLGVGALQGRGPLPTRFELVAPFTTVLWLCASAILNRKVQAHIEADDPRLNQA
jgi:hypothetical protein